MQMANKATFEHLEASFTFVCLSSFAQQRQRNFSFKLQIDKTKFFSLIVGNEYLT